MAAKRDLKWSREFRKLDLFDLLILDDIEYQRSKHPKRSAPCSRSWLNGMSAAACSSPPFWSTMVLIKAGLLQNLVVCEWLNVYSI